MEQWKDIEGYDGDYQISSYGNVRTFKQGAQGKLLKLMDSKESYQKVNLYKDGKMTTYLVHILVGRAFIPNPNNYPQVNHIDGDKTNNRADNLEWVSNDANRKHAVANGLHAHGESCPWAKLTREKVEFIREHKEITSKQFAEMFNVSDSTIRSARRGDSWK
jgi:DNA-binding transcriptional regulator YiaG